MFAPERSYTGKLPDALTKDVSPSVGGVLYPGTGMGTGPSSIFPRVDPVLVAVSQTGDEREYERMMRTSWAIGTAIKQRTTGLMAHGDQIIEGRAHSKASRMLADFLREFIDSIGGETARGGSAVPRARFSTLRRQVLKALYYGWLPVEFQWSNEDFTFQGRPRAGVVDAKVRKPWYYHFTRGGFLALTSADRDQVYDQPDDEGRFMVARAFDTESWYGESDLRGFWLLCFTAQQFAKMSGEAMQRALGIIKATRKPGASQGLGGAAPQQSKAEAELNAALRKFRSNNLLIESQNYSFDIIENAIGQNVTKVLDYFATEQRMAILGQNLTSKVEGGSYAAANSHVDILENYLMADAREELAWWNDGLFRMAIEVNFGQVDTDDLPRWQSRIVDRPNLEATKMLYDLGAPVDGRRLADGTNAALWTGDEEGPEDVVLRKSTTAPVSGATGDAAPAPPADPKAQAGEGQKVEVSQAAMLNGAQISAATAIVMSVAAGEIPRDAGLGQLQVLFNLTPEQANSIMGSAGTNTPTTPNPNPATQTAASLAPSAPPPTPDAEPTRSKPWYYFFSRARRSAVEGVALATDRAQETALSSAMRTASPELEDYYSALADRYLAEHPDPKA